MNIIEPQFGCSEQEGRREAEYGVDSILGSGVEDEQPEPDFDERT